MKKKRILYLFSDTGGGHRAAAKALTNAVERVRGRIQVEQSMVDAFAECSGFLNIFARLYGPMVRYSPALWGKIFYWWNDAKKLERLEKIARPFIQRELANYFRKKNPDVVVSVHPMINHLAAQALKGIKKKIPLITVVMDPVSVHRAWFCPDVDLVIVATDRAKDFAIKDNIPKKKIKACGIPIDPRFLDKTKAKKMLRKEMGLDPNLFTVLIMGGGEGGGNIYNIIRTINKTKHPIQLIVIAGRNNDLKQRLIAEQSLGKLKLPMKVFGFTEEVPKIMSASDLLISKAGPGAIYEAMAKNLPIIVTSWLPGQEEGNVRFVLEHKIGDVAKNPKKILPLISKYLKPS
ncbi:MAG: glycosyltransferase, partial [bacterium]